jgi:hypothetical protein
MKRILILAAGFLGFATASNAQVLATSSASQTAELSLTNALSILFNSSGTTTGSTVSFPFSTIAHYTNGVTSSAQQLDVSSNLPYAVTVKASAATFTYSGSATTQNVMPVSGVLNIIVPTNGTGGTLSTFSNSVYQTLTNVDQPLIAAATNTSGSSFSVTYKATPGFLYAAGTYSVNVVYTATQL